MNRDLIRHKILKILVENYYQVKQKFGDPDLNPIDFERLEIPVSDLIRNIGISYSDFDQAKTKALKDKSFKIVENRAHDECCILSDNTFLYYNEKIYLKESKHFY